MKASNKGREGEALAASFLEERGYQILKRNYRSFVGEVDIVAVRDDVLVFCEVKTWDAYSVSEMEYSIDTEKQRRIFLTAEAFIAAFPFYRECELRFDLVFLSEGMRKLHHLENAFYRD